MRTAKLMCAEIQIQFHSHLSRLLIGTDVRSLFGRHFVRILVARYRIVTTLPTTWAEHAVSARYYIVTMYGTPLPRPAGRGGQHLICSQGPRPIWARICLVRDSDTAPLCCGVAPVRFPGARESSWAALATPRSTAAGNKLARQETPTHRSLRTGSLVDTPVHMKPARFFLCSAAGYLRTRTVRRPVTFTFAARPHRCTLTVVAHARLSPPTPPSLSPCLHLLPSRTPRALENASPPTDET